MSKISSFPTATPKVADLLLGTDIADSSKTKNFTIGSIGTLIGSPQSVTVNVTAAQLLTGATAPIMIKGPVGAGISIAIDNVYVAMTGGTVAYDYPTDMGVSVYNTAVYLQRTQTLVHELLNLPVAGNIQYRRLQPEYQADLLFGGEPFAENGGIYMMADSGANPTVGNGILTVTAYYTLFDTATLVPQNS